MLIWASIVHQPCVPHFQVFWHSQLLRVSTLTYNTLQWSTLMFSSCNCFIYETLTTAYFMGTKPVFLWFLLILHFCSSWFTKSCTHWLVFPLLNLPFLIQVLIHIQIWLIHQLNENSSDSPSYFHISFENKFASGSGFLSFSPIDVYLDQTWKNVRKNGGNFSAWIYMGPFS